MKIPDLAIGAEYQINFRYTKHIMKYNTEIQASTSSINALLGPSIIIPALDTLAPKQWTIWKRQVFGDRGMGILTKHYRDLVSKEMKIDIWANAVHVVIPTKTRLTYRGGDDLDFAMMDAGIEEKVPGCSFRGISWETIARALLWRSEVNSLAIPEVGVYDRPDYNPGVFIVDSKTGNGDRYTVKLGAKSSCTCRLWKDVNRARQCGDLAPLFEAIGQVFPSKHSSSMYDREIHQVPENYREGTFMCHHQIRVLTETMPILTEAEQDWWCENTGSWISSAPDCHEYMTHDEEPDGSPSPSQLIVPQGCNEQWRIKLAENKHKLLLIRWSSIVREYEKTVAMYSL